MDQRRDHDGLELGLGVPAETTALKNSARGVVKGRFNSRRAKMMATVKKTLLGAAMDGRAGFGAVSRAGVDEVMSGEAEGYKKLPSVTQENLRISARRVVDDLQAMVKAAYEAGVADAIAGVATGSPVSPKFEDWYLHEPVVDWVEL